MYVHIHHSRHVPDTQWSATGHFVPASERAYVDVDGHWITLENGELDSITFHFRDQADVDQLITVIQQAAFQHDVEAGVVPVPEREGQKVSEYE